MTLFLNLRAQGQDTFSQTSVEYNMWSGPGCTSPRVLHGVIHSALHCYQQRLRGEVVHDSFPSRLAARMLTHSDLTPTEQVALKAEPRHIDQTGFLKASGRSWSEGSCNREGKRGRRRAEMQEERKTCPTLALALIETHKEDRHAEEAGGCWWYLHEDSVPNMAGPGAMEGEGGRQGGRRGESREETGQGRSRNGSAAVEEGEWKWKGIREK
ncbi:hypothetical protein KUCAC02_020966, partial [Chaenocephalus aceratus]